MLKTNVLLGAIAGVTIFLGLPIARWRGASERLRGMLTFASAGVLSVPAVDVKSLIEQAERGLTK